MKSLLTFSALVFSFFTQAQDWALFPLNQQTYYHRAYPTNPVELKMQVMDSVKVLGNQSIQYFKKKLPIPGAGACRDFLADRIRSLDSIVTRNDSVFYYLGNANNRPPFLFLPKANVGDTWVGREPSIVNYQNGVTVNCVSTQIESFLGVTDSVKTFEFTAFHNSSNPFIGFHMKLSKNHGLLEYFPFEDLFKTPLSAPYTHEVIAGVKTPTTSFGFRQPTLFDYFPYQTGDVLIWENVRTRLNVSNEYSYQRDSFVSVTRYPDSIVMVYNTTTINGNQIYTYQNQRDIVNRMNYRNILEKTPKWYALEQSHLNGEKHIWQTDRLMVDYNSSTPVVTYSLGYNAEVIDTLNCIISNLFDTGQSRTYSTQYGLIESCNNSILIYCTRLIGSRIGYQVNGNIDFSLYLDVNHIAGNDQSINLFPNPATNMLQVSIPDASGTELVEVYDLMGNLALRETLQGSALDISQLPVGAYMLRVHTDKGLKSGRFVKLEN